MSNRLSMGQTASTASRTSIGGDKATQDDFEAWKTCWEVNLLFYKPARGPQTCVACRQTNDYGPGIRRSTFWMATRCLAGHGQGTLDILDKRRPVPPGGSSSPGICAKCDQDFILEILKGKYGCKREGCRRLIRINEGMVRQALVDSGSPALIE